MKHQIYTEADVRALSEEYGFKDRLYELVVEGGLAVCKHCGEYEAGLEGACKPRKPMEQTRG